MIDIIKYSEAIVGIIAVILYPRLLPYVLLYFVVRNYLKSN